MEKSKNKQTKDCENYNQIYDYAIFGGGVVGCAIFNKLTRLNQKTILIEKAEDVCTGASKANSAIIHAGFDAKEGSLKAKLNVKGNRLMKNLCAELDVPFKEVGAVVVGNSIEKIQELYNRGLKNGLSGNELEIVEGEKLHALIPALKDEIKFGLWAKNSGIVNVFMLTIALAEEAVINGGVFKSSFETKKINYKNNIFEISNGTQTVCARKIINCAGWGVNEILKLLGEKEYNLNFRRGEYFVLDRDAGDFVNLTVFPLPTEKGKGILATPTTDGNLLFGPTSTPCENYQTQTTAEGLKEIKTGIASLFKNPPFHLAIREYAGTRVGCGEDFVIERGKNENIITICGINSPGLTASPAIAEMICEMENLNAKEKQMQRRKSYNCIALQSAKQMESLIEKEKKYGQIICKCEMVSLQEILNAIHSPLAPHTLDAVKRRVRSTAGHCQGGFCTMKVASIIASELNIPLAQVLKENKGSCLSELGKLN